MKQTFTLIFILSVCINLSAHPVSHNVMSFLAQGGDQPVFIASFDKESENSDFKVRIYPNPATDFIRVEWESDQDHEVHVELYDLVGRRISRRKSEESINRIHIDMKSFQRSAYLVKVFTIDGKYSRTYRIIKQ
jgi:hypothetical protein